MDHIQCYIITSGVYFIQEHKISGYRKTKVFNGRCLFMSKELTENIIIHLTDINHDHFKNLKIIEYSLVKGDIL